MNTYGRMSIPSGTLVLVDPCYINPAMLSLVRIGAKSENEREHLVIHVEGVSEATIRYQLDPETSRLAAVEIVFDEAESHSMGRIGDIWVDSGQMSYCDAQHLLDHWKEAPYLDIRKYRNVEDGRILQYQLDFPNYEAPIASAGGSTMNSLIAGGQWEKMPYDGPIETDYNGMSHCHDDGDGLGMVGDHVLVTDTGWGDGSYPVEKFMTRDGRLARLRVVFIEETDEDGEGEDDDEK